MCIIKKVVKRMDDVVTVICVLKSELTTKKNSQTFMAATMNKCQANEPSLCPLLYIELGRAPPE